MNKENYKIHIVGAGISGLIAAKVLENHGYHPVIIEASDRAGGRVKTDQVGQYRLDHGFQVLLTTYPAVQKYLNIDSLSLESFLPGAQIFNNGKTTIIGDPGRDISLLLPTITSTVGTFSDKLKVLRLNRILKRTAISDLFEEEEQSTYNFLVEFGFSKVMIEQFFRPFFSGIFLELDLQTSSRMFKFIYKMFGEGNAAIPKNGIEDIAKQLVVQLRATSFMYNTSVKQVEEGKIYLTDGDDLESHFTIIATDPSPIVKNLRNQNTVWKSCDTLYFETDNKAIHKPLIGLIADAESLINNIHYQSNTDSKSLLSVTVVKDHHLREEELITQVKTELKKFCNIETTRFLKRYQIKQALPNLSNVQYEMLPSETKLNSRVFLAGDQQLNGSLNAAMISGERAAMGIIDTLEKGLIVEEFTSEFN